MSLRMSDRMVADLDAVEVAARRQIEAELERPSPDLKRKIRALAAAAMSNGQNDRHDDWVYHWACH